MDWLSGYAAGWDVYTVDPGTWADAGRVEGVMSVSVSRDGTDALPLLEAGRMELDTAAPFDWAWCRVRMRAEQGGSERFPIATMLFERGDRRTSHRAPMCTMSGFSVLKPCADLVLPSGSYAPAGTDGAAFAASLLRGHTPAPIVVDGSFMLSDDVVFDMGSSRLAAAWAVLRAAGWCMRIDGEGVVRIGEKPKTASLELDKAHAALLIPGVDETLDISRIPNRYIAMDGGETAIATNEDASLLASRQNRGRWVDMLDTSPTPVDGEPLQAYANRRLAEESTVLREFSYTREFWPGVVPFDLVKASLPEHGVEGDLRVLSQEFDCGKGIKITERAGKEVRV